jgi:hypothetical protein
VKGSAPQVKEPDQPAKVVKPSAPPKPQQEIEAAPPIKIEDANPPVIAPAEDQKTK